MDKRLLTITELARRSGIPSRTIRFWSDEGLIPVVQRSAARYRLYDEAAVARLDLVHTLRELGLSIAGITTILRRQQSIAQVAVTHVAALDTRIRDLRLQRAVLRVLIRRSSNPEETRLMQKLAQTSATERQRLIDDFVARAFEGIADDAPGARIGKAMRSLPAELPDDPSDAQVETWLELAALVSDDTFAARVREMAVAGASGGAPLPVEISVIREHAAAALASNIEPASAAADPVVQRILPGELSREARLQLRQQLEAFNDVRVERYWQLLGALHGRPAFPPTAPACAWFIAALRARE
jgi:DNA-binding transcriptional MerR regulator